MANTVRNEVLQQLTERLESIREGQPVDDPYPTSFSMVVRGPFPDRLGNKKAAAAVRWAQDQVAGLNYPVTDKRLQAVVQLYAYAGSGNPEDVMDELAGVVERRVGEDRSLNGTALDTRVQSVEMDIIDGDDRTANAAVVLNIDYRHLNTDPRRGL